MNNSQAKNTSRTDIIRNVAFYFFGMLLALFLNAYFTFPVSFTKDHILFESLSLSFMAVSLFGLYVLNRGLFTYKGHKSLDHIIAGTLMIFSKVAFVFIISAFMH